jgi:hypothetical protein
VVSYLVEISTLSRIKISHQCKFSVCYIVNNASDLSLVCRISPGLTRDKVDGRITPRRMKGVVDGLGADGKSTGD